MARRRGGLFERMAFWCTRWAGSSLAFALALGSILVWAATGPYYHYSDTWQIVINTATTIITFLMVFLIQHTQNVNEHAMQRKLDELITKLPGPDSSVAGIERE